MMRLSPAVALCLAAFAASSACRGEDLMDVYRDAQRNDPVVAAARSAPTKTFETT